jgi:hypothetical protein
LVRLDAVTLATVLVTGYGTDESMTPFMIQLAACTSGR